ncbi:Arsenite methyltransferase [Fulvia fulva]|nr:Arsenite methyltransferase [Fulvia fulva]WPV12927.1 Arsenite methyltransferase [Fulvia fulva]
MGSTTIYDQVTTHYGKAAKEDYGDGSYGARVAAEFGYSQEELDSVPQESNLGLSCGNPLAIAGIREGEVVVDLGSGAGFDVFQVAKKVGLKGKAIGIDSSDNMLARANQIKTKLSHGDNVQFVKSGITDISLEDSSADCIISNCVVNLVPEEDKHLVFTEMARVLKPGGRVAISDILAKGPLPEEVKNSMALYVGCIAGASQVESYEKWLREAAFKDVLIVDSKSDLNVYRHSDGTNAGCCAPPEPAKEEKKGGCCGPKKTSVPAQAKTVEDFGDVDFNQFAGSFKIYAIKP